MGVAAVANDPVTPGGGDTTYAYWGSGTSATLSAEINLAAFSGLVLNTSGTPTAGVVNTDYIGPTTAPLFVIADAGTNTASLVTTFTHTTSATPAARFGNEVLHKIESLSTNAVSAVALRSVLSSVASAAEDGSFRIGLMAAGAAIPVAGSEQYIFTTDYMQVPVGVVSLRLGPYVSGIGGGDTYVALYAGGTRFLYGISAGGGGSYALMEEAIRIAKVGTTSVVSIQRNGDTNTGINFTATADDFALIAGAADIVHVAYVSSTARLGLYGVTPAIQGAVGATLTNNVTAGGTTNQLDDFTSMTVYATDAAAIRNGIYQLGLKVATMEAKLKLLGAVVT